MSDVLTLIDRQLQYKQEAAERYTGRARLAIKTDIETLKRAREEILRLEEVAMKWNQQTEIVKGELTEALNRIEFLEEQWKFELELDDVLIAQLNGELTKQD